MKTEYKCKKCITHPMIPNLMGDGWCEKHNLRFSFCLPNQPCPQCAIEQNLCIDCGSEIEKSEGELKHYEKGI